MERVALVSAVRTPIGRYGGSLKDVPVSTLGALVLNAALDKAGLKPEVVEEVVTAQAYQNGECANAGRVALLEAGWPDTVGALTLDRRCCSGVDAIWIAAMKIQTGNASVAVAAGMESMSRAEMYLPGEIKWGLGGKKDPKWGFMPRGHGAMSMWGVPIYDRIQRARVMSQPIERYGELNSMMAWAETAAKMEGITREAADEWSARSHAKAVAAMEAGLFADELVPVPLPPSKKGPTSLDADETPRPGTTVEKLAKLPTVYPDGVCTAGNSSSENDGAAAMVLMSESKVKELGLEPLAWFEGAAIGACDPTLTYPGVPVAVNGALAKAGMELADIELFEIQEAFAVQMLADAKLMGVPREDYDSKINVNGSGISLGHPIGATGVMRTTTLLHQMKRQEASKGLVTICGGGGQGIAAIFTR